MGPNHAIANSLYKRLPFDFLRNTEPVGGIMRLTNLMVVPQSLPVKTVQEFIDHAKANPGKLSMASTGVGTSVHLSGELFKVMTKTDIVHVQYRGSAHVVCGPLHRQGPCDVWQHDQRARLVRSGRLRGLGVTSAKRWDSLPDIPTIAETSLVTRPTSGMGSSRRKARPQRSLLRSTRRLMQGLPTPRCARASNRRAGTNAHDSATSAR